MNAIVLKYTPEDLDDIKPLLPGVASRYVASRYMQAQKHLFQPLAFGNKKYILFTPKHLGKS